MLPCQIHRYLPRSRCTTRWSAAQQSAGVFKHSATHPATCATHPGAQFHASTVDEIDQVERAAAERGAPPHLMVSMSATTR